MESLRVVFGQVRSGASVHEAISLLQQQPRVCYIRLNNSKPNQRGVASRNGGRAESTSCFAIMREAGSACRKLCIARPLSRTNELVGQRFFSVK